MNQSIANNVNRFVIIMFTTINQIHNNINCIVIIKLCQWYTLHVHSYNLGNEMLFRGRTSAHGAMGRWIDPSWWTQSYFSFQPVLHDWCKKGCGNVLSCLWDDAYKRTFAANQKE